MGQIINGGYGCAYHGELVLTIVEAAADAAVKNIFLTLHSSSSYAILALSP